MLGPKALVRALLGETLANEVRRYTTARKLRTGQLDDCEKETALLGRLVPRGGVALDIGANLGVYSRLLSRAVGPDGRVHAFEPVPMTYAALVQNAQAFPYPNVITYHMAISIDRGPCTIVLPNLGSVSIYQARLAGLDGGDGRRFTVGAFAVDQLHGTYFNRVDFIKCDVEGAELLVMQSAEATLAAHHPAILCEIGGGTEHFGYAPQAVFDWLAERGYRAQYYTGTTMVSCTGLCADNTNPNYIFTHPARTVTLP